MPMPRVMPGVNRWRTTDTAAVNPSHHSADPSMTPTTSATAGCHPELTRNPNPANTAMKDRIVAGLLSVSATIDP